jgi:UDP-2,4-diacetamido-2,4,6-trideoxy-beta-L-altropyranose hydrolase
MRVALRVDASRQIGIGHFVRCLTLADALKNAGAHTRFVCRHLPQSLHGWLSSRQHELVLLESVPADELDELPHARFLGVSQRSDAQATLGALSDEGHAKWDWVAVDHYGIDARWETALREVAAHIVAIDDVADRAHDCDVLLDQNLYSDMEVRYAGKIPRGCEALLGPRYALVRQEFAQLRAGTKPRTGPLRRVLVFFGGIDPANFTNRALRALCKVGRAALQVDIVIGAEHPNRREIEAACADNGLECHVQTSRMAALMAAADFSLGAGGSASWERCSLGLPAGSVAWADNQLEIARALEAAGASVFLGNEVTATQEKMEATLASVMADDRLLAEMSAAAFALVDGLGSQRVLTAMSGRT